jgi:hypothetical protein
MTPFQTARYGFVSNAYGDVIKFKVINCVFPTPVSANPCEKQYDSFGLTQGVQIMRYCQSLRYDSCGPPT